MILLRYLLKLKPIIVIAVLISGSLDVLADNKYIYDPEPNGLDYADHYGKLSAWYNMGEVRLADGVVLPLRLNFHGAQDKIGNSILGWNWWFPLMESTVTKKSESEVVARMIGGRRLHLHKSASDSNLYRSSDGTWQGRLGDGGDFVLKSTVEKWKLLFVKGKLQSMMLPGGEKLEWSYDVNGRPMSLTSDADGKLVDLIYGTEGVERFTYLDEKGYSREVKVHVGSAVEVGLPILVSSLKSLNSPMEKVENFNYFVENDGFNLVSEHAKDSTSRVKEEVFKWSGKDGMAKFVNGDTYTVVPNGERPSLLKTDANGKKSSYHFDSVTGVAKTVYGNRESIRKYSLTKGPMFGKVLSFAISDGGEKIYDAINYYSSEGVLIRKSMNDGQYQKFFRDDGSLLKVVDRGSEHFYGENGELISSNIDSLEIPVQKILDKKGGLTILEIRGKKQIIYPSQGEILDNIKVK